jgi:hypothetical protein
VGEFKFNFGFALCQPCENKPTNAYYTSKAVATSQCPYECSAGLETSDVNHKCESTLELQLTKMGSLHSSLIVLGAFLLITFAVWMGLLVASSANQKAFGDFNSTLYDSVLLGTSGLDLDADQILGKSQLAMQDSDIYSHTHRMYLIGDNSVEFPWYIAKDFPSNSLNEENMDRLMNLIKNDQWTLDWSSLAKQTTRLIRLFFPYLSDWTARAFRRRHFTQISDKIYAAYDTSFWEDQGGKTIRFAPGSQDYQLAYIDFLDKTRTRHDYVGPQLPMCLMLNGNGTFGTPYSVNFENDPLAKSLVLLNKDVLKSKLPLFFANLNTLLAKLSFYKFNRQSMRDLDEVIDWVDMGNKSLFASLDVKATLYLFENSYQEV